VADDNLYALTYNYPVFIPTRPQTIQTNENLTYVGTGEIFSIPPKRLTTTDYPYGGCRDFMSVVTTDFGTFYADSEHGKVHRLGNPVTDINAGISNWLEQNLPFKIDEQFYQLLGIKYPWRYSTNGIGIVSTYDPRHKRYIITKNDYQIADEETFGGILDFSDTSSIPGTLYWDDSLGVFFIKLDGIVNQVVPLNNFLYFKNFSWTLSYSPRHNSWVSYHSYLPYNYLQDGNTFYSVKQYLPRLYTHNVGNYQTYYNEAKKNHVIEFIANGNPQEVKTLGGVELICNSTLNGVDSDIIFNQA